MHPFLGDTQVHARHWVPMSGTQWVSHCFFWDTHILKPKNRCTRATGCRCLVPNGCHTQFFLMHPFLGDTQVHCQCLAPNGCHTIFLGYTHFKTKKKVHARHWVPMSGTQWVSHPVFFDAPIFWGTAGACAMSGTKWCVSQKNGVTPIGCQTLALGVGTRCGFLAAPN